MHLYHRSYPPLIPSSHPGSPVSQIYHYHHHDAAPRQIIRRLPLIIRSLRQREELYDHSHNHDRDRTHSADDLSRHTSSSCVQLRRRTCVLRKRCAQRAGLRRRRNARRGRARKRLLLLLRLRRKEKINLCLGQFEIDYSSSFIFFGVLWGNEMNYEMN